MTNDNDNGIMYPRGEFDVEVRTPSAFKAAVKNAEALGFELDGVSAVSSYGWVVHDRDFGDDWNPKTGYTRSWDVTPGRKWFTIDYNDDEPAFRVRSGGRDHFDHGPARFRLTFVRNGARSW